MHTPYGHCQIQRVADGISARLLEPPTFYARVSPTANIADLAAASTTQDGATIAAGDILLLTAQSDASENGLYVAGEVASSAAPLSRALNFDASVEIVPGTVVFVSEGTARGNKRYQLTANAPIVIDTTNLTFVELLSGSTLSPTTTPAMQAVDATLALGTTTISTGIAVAANSEVLARPKGALTGTTNFALVRELAASRVNGIAGVGTLVIEAITNAGVLDSDAAGAIRVVILTPQS